MYTYVYIVIIIIIITYRERVFIFLYNFFLDYRLSRRYKMNALRDYDAISQFRRRGYIYREGNRKREKKSLVLKF